jgi:hypothetical protein
MFIVDVQNIRTNLDLKANSIVPTIPCLQHAHFSAGFSSVFWHGDGFSSHEKLQRLLSPWQDFVVNHHHSHRRGNLKSYIILIFIAPRQIWQLTREDIILVLNFLIIFL